MPSLQATVADSRTVTITSLATSGTAEFTVRAAGGADATTITPAAGEQRTVRLTGIPLTPPADIALTKTTFPTSPLPPSMTDPDLAVDGDPATAWQPGTGGRMVVDLRVRWALGRAALTWRPGRVTPAVLSVSGDGITYRRVATAAGQGEESIPLTGTAARYVAVRAPPWPGNAGLGETAIYPAS